MEQNVKTIVLAELPKTPRFSPTAHWMTRIPKRAAAQRRFLTPSGNRRYDCLARSGGAGGARSVVKLRYEGGVDKVNLPGQDWRE